MKFLREPNRSSADSRPVRIFTAVGWVVVVVLMGVLSIGLIGADWPPLAKLLAMAFVWGSLALAFKDARTSKNLRR